VSHGGDDGLPEEHEEHVNHEAWVIPYADLLTLLMAMFIALFAMSTVDMSKFKELALGFNEALGGGKLDAGIGGSGKATSPAIGEGNGAGPFDGGTLLPSNDPETSNKIATILAGLSKNRELKERERQTLEEVKHDIDEAARSLGLGGKVQTRTLENGLEVTLLTDRVLFDSGKADIEAEGMPLLEVIAEVLKELDNRVEIRGHTDGDPLRPNARFFDNLDLSSARANAVARLFSSLGVDRRRLMPVGYGDVRPIASNETASGKAKNRRVEIVVVSNQVDRALAEAGLTDEPAKEDRAGTPVEPPDPGVDGARPDLSPGLGAHAG
jgi:chemotaxis protein MotB